MLFYPKKSHSMFWTLTSISTLCSHKKSSLTRIAQRSPKQGALSKLFWDLRSNSRPKRRVKYLQRLPLRTSKKRILALQMISTLTEETWTIGTPLTILKLANLTGKESHVLTLAGSAVAHATNRKEAARTKKMRQGLPTCRISSLK